ncbi:MAG: serine hydrolase [Candidatus Aminicenantes bacterium]|nr:MAG: serine hydrolase [Candidatus Aminicenantes bacterium]
MKKSLCIIYSLLLLTLLWTTITCKPVEQTGDDPLSEKTDKLFSEWDKPDSPGASLAVIKDGSVIYKAGYGSAQLEYSIPITPSTVFHVASVSKQFTAFAITMLADQGKLSLDDDIHKHLPEIPDFGKTVTIRHLIHHISGIRDQWELLAMAGWRLDDVITKEHILKMVKHQRDLNFEPGAEYLYCNTGFTLMAEIVARVTGQSFREWTEKNIFKPLGMSNTQFYDDHERIVKNRAYSYAKDNDKGFKKRVLSYANVGATSLFTTAEDLAKWLLNFEEKRVGGSAIIEQVHKQGVLNNGKEISYAFGLIIGEHKGLRTVGHGGADAGYRSNVMHFPEQKFGVVVLSNLANFNPSSLARQVAEVYLADQIKEEEKEGEKTVKVDRKVLDSYTGKYKLKAGPVVTIARERNRLVAKAGDEVKVELIPESETKFFVKEIDAHITFQRTESEKASRFILHQGEEDIPAQRIEPPTLNPKQLAEFAGDYYSEELGTTYTIVVQDEQLVAQHRRHDDIKLNPTDMDQFVGEQWFFSQVQFTRDKEKKLTGFLLTGSRVRNLRFDKQ